MYKQVEHTLVAPSVTSDTYVILGPVFADAQVCSVKEMEIRRSGADREELEIMQVSAFMPG